MNNGQQKVQMVRMVDNTEPRKDHEEKRYLICIEETDGQRDWCIVIGRTAAYNHIKDTIDTINFEESFVLVETLKLADRKSLYSFMKYAQDFYEDGFDVDDYIRGDFDEGDFLRNSNQEDGELMQAINNAGNDRLNMASFMNGEIKATPLN